MEIAAFSIFGAAMIAGFGWVMKTLISHGNRLTEIETKLNMLIKRGENHGS
jgi:hypothetical protein